MEKLKRSVRTFLILGIVAAVLGVAGIPGIPIFAGRALYPLMALSIVLVAHGFYGTPMYFVTYGAKRASLRLVTLVEEQKQRSYSSLAACLSMQEDAVRQQLAACIQAGYLVGFRLGETALEALTDETPETPTATKCEYCGLVVSAGATVCPHCGAPLGTQIPVDK